MAAKKTKKKAAAAPKKKDAGSLLDEILANPDDLATRAVYADSLIEAGDPRGTFIAQQCADVDALDERYPPMLASTMRLEALHARTWLAEYAKATTLEPDLAAKAPVDDRFNAVFEHGFLKRIAMLPSEVAKHWPLLRAREPIAGIELMVGENLDRKYHRLPVAQDFTVLKVSPAGWFTSNSVADVLRWGMPDVSDLDLSGCDLGPTGCHILTNAPTELKTYFPDYVPPPPFARGQLKRLTLKNCSVADAGARILFAGDSLTGLEALDLAQDKIADPATLEALRDAPAMRSLTHLTLSGNNALGAALERLADWPALPRLVQLALPQSTTVASFKALFPMPSPCLRELDLTSCKELLQSPYDVVASAEALVSLDIGSTSVGDAGWNVLLAAPSLARLVHLYANGCSLSDAAVVALTRSPLQRLVTLDLSSNKLTDAALVALAKWPCIEHVAYLRLSNNKKLTAAGYDALLAAEGFQPATLDIGKPPDASIVARLRNRFGDVVLAK